jgi:hypothetical protein
VHCYSLYGGVDSISAFRTKVATVKEQVWIDYVNYRGERKWYRILPVNMRFGNNDFYAEDQWLIEAMDLDSPGVVREFAWYHIKETRRTPPGIIK